MKLYIKSLLLMATLAASACEAKVPNRIPSPARVVQSNAIRMQPVQQVGQLDEEKQDLLALFTIGCSLFGSVCAHAYKETFRQFGKRDYEALITVGTSAIFAILGCLNSYYYHLPQIKDAQLSLKKRAKALALSAAVVSSVSTFAYYSQKMF